MEIPKSPLVSHREVSLHKALRLQGQALPAALLVVWADSSAWRHGLSCASQGATHCMPATLLTPSPSAINTFSRRLLGVGVNPSLAGNHCHRGGQITGGGIIPNV